MSNQFVYQVTHQGSTPEEIVTTRASFNISKVIRSLELQDGRVIVILDDFHTVIQNGPDGVNHATKRLIKGVREATSVQSEIELDKEDGIRFFNTLGLK
jgi:ATP/maltotriose-dependent transcriptional regulator MalT